MRLVGGCSVFSPCLNTHHDRSRSPRRHDHGEHVRRMDDFIRLGNVDERASEVLKEQRLDVQLAVMEE
eukprot:2859217-Amphidinium_carterae.1